MPRLIDTNVVARVLLQDCSHPKYTICVRELLRGGLIPIYVLPELNYLFLADTRKTIARKHAEETGDMEFLQKFGRNYINQVQMPAGWKKHSASDFRVSIKQFLQDYPEISFQYPDLVETALAIMEETGHDCVDCLLIAERIMRGHEVVSVDKDLSWGTAAYSRPKGLNRLNLV